MLKRKKEVNLLSFADAKKLSDFVLILIDIDKANIKKGLYSKRTASAKRKPKSVDPPERGSCFFKNQLYSFSNSLNSNLQRWVYDRHHCFNINQLYVSHKRA